MGETSAYYVPIRDAALLGRNDELTERCWEQGLFLATADDRIYKRIQQWRQDGRELPAWHHNFGFASMGLVESPLTDPVPNMPYEIRCPACGTCPRQPGTGRRARPLRAGRGRW